MNRIKAGIVGGAGYTGGELLRLLLHHPSVSVAFVQSRSQAGKPLSAVHPDLLGETELCFVPDTDFSVDVLFLCLAHGEAAAWLARHEPVEGLRIIDLSHDFRAGGSWGKREFQYGLPELYRDAIRTSELVANPGCFATALQLALLPLAAAGQLQEVFATGITGATGAGQSLSATAHFPWRHANISAYKTLEHQHLAEIMRSLQLGSAGARLHFVPWRGDFARGIFVSCTLAQSDTLASLNERYAQYYDRHPFTLVSPGSINLKMVVNTNKCVLQLEQQDGMLVVHAAIDNLLKGAAGQAVQNMNLMFGLDERSGLQLKASTF